MGRRPERRQQGVTPEAEARLDPEALGATALAAAFARWDVRGTGGLTLDEAETVSASWTPFLIESKRSMHTHVYDRRSKDAYYHHRLPQHAALSRAADRAHWNAGGVRACFLGARAQTSVASGVPSCGQRLERSGRPRRLPQAAAPLLCPAPPGLFTQP